MRRGRAGLALAIPALLFTALFFLVPLAVMAVQSLGQRVAGKPLPGWTLANYERFLAKDYLYQALVNSLEVTVLVTLASLVLAYPVAWVIAFRVSPRWQRLALLLAVLPFWTSYLVRSYSWLLVLSPEGVVPSALRALGLDLGLPLVSNRTGTVIGFVHFFTMLLTLTIYASLVQIPPSCLRAAADLGATPWQAFWRVTLPLSAPGIVVGAFLTFVLTIGDYITPQILGGNRELLLPQAIMLQIGRQADFPMAAALSLILMLVISLAYLACARWLRLGR